MRESVVYQRVLAEGHAEGRGQALLEGRLSGCPSVLLAVGQHKFQTISPSVLGRLATIEDPAELTRMAARVPGVSGWH